MPARGGAGRDVGLAEIAAVGEQGRRAAQRLGKPAELGLDRRDLPLVVGGGRGEGRGAERSKAGTGLGSDMPCCGGIATRRPIGYMRPAAHP